ncbi:MAG TPA: hypothetical protein VFK57_06605 [Vicinamibacterales bacterium]|nr:hypothetical protein [Vicinamibacterales bacterium]
MTRQTVARWFGAAGVLFACGVAGLSAVPDARPQAAPPAGAPCSDRTIRGDYGFSIDGTILAGTPNAFLLRGVAMTHFDGEGGLTQVDFTTRNGAPFSPDWRSATGTYAINPDCTGTATIVPSDGTPSVQLRLVVTDHGRQIRTVVVGNASGSVGIRAN